MQIKNNLVLLVVLFVLLYLSLFLPLIFHAPAKVALSHNISAEHNKALVIPKTAAIGEEIEVELYYFPRLFRKDRSMRLGFKDSSGAFGPSNEITFPKELWYLPHYAKFKYKIPSKVCPLYIVYTTCPEVKTKKGPAQINFHYSPETFPELGEGYQGDGERVSVPITIK